MSSTATPGSYPSHLALAWVLTLPAAVLLSGSLYWLFTRFF